MIETSRVISMQCVCCGAKLDIANDMDTFACGYCGNHLSVERRGGTVALRHVVDAIQKVQAGTDKMAAELALARLEKEREKLQEQLKWVDSKGERRVDEADVNTIMCLFTSIFLLICLVILVLTGSNLIKGITLSLTYIFLSLTAMAFIYLSYRCRKESMQRTRECAQAKAPIFIDLAALNSEIERNKVIVNS